MEKKIIAILVRYGLATIGLTLVALGVSLSIVSNLGTSPISCLPYVLNLWGGLSVGTFTAMMHVSFIILQIVLLRRKFRVESLMQLVAAVVFGALTDFFIWGTSWIAASNYISRVLLMVLAVLITAFGISMEVRAKAWMLAGEMTVAAIAEVTHTKFRNTKIVFDTSLVVISAVLSLIFWGNAMGNGEQIVIREGTLVLALLTGYVMRYTDPMVERLIGSIVDRHQY